MLKIFFYIFIVVLVYSCSENRANTKSISKENSPGSDTILLMDTTPVYTYLFDSTLADGFVYPVKWESKSADRNFTFLKKIVKDDGPVSDSISEWFLFNPKARDFVIIQMPANGFIFKVKKKPNNLFSITTYHSFVENGTKKELFFVIDGLDSVSTNSSGLISKGTEIGRAKGVLLTDKSSVKITAVKGKENVPFYFNSPATFIKEYSDCFIPQKTDKLLFAHKSDYKMYFFEKGVLINEYTIALSQDPVGHKQKQGDNKLPEGMYRITEKSRGPFYGDTGPWLGVAWMQFSYPNQFDAINGYNDGTISLAEKNAIVNADRSKKSTNSYTNLGGRVGLHGWNGDWIPNGTQNLTWGCISMFNRDIDQLYDLLPAGSTIIIQP